MPRPIWSGAISFGLVNVPVKLFSATSPKTVRFNELHDEDRVKLTRKRICPSPEHGPEGEEVAYENVVKGFEIAPDQYVVVTRDELEALAPKATRTIEIEDFVELDDIDPIHFEHPYYLVPDRGAAKSYALLLAAMRESRKVAIARVVLRTKGYLAAIRPVGNALAMTTMLYPDEVVDQDTIDGLPDEADPPARELKMAQQLIDSLTSDWDPSRYRDEYREQVLDLIERKAEGEVVQQPPREEPAAPVLDLVAALEASLAEAKKKPKTSSKSRARAGADGDGAAPKKRAAKKRTAKEAARG